MMIFILAAGYLFTVYVLLALAKRTRQKSSLGDFPVVGTKIKHQQELGVTPKVTEVVNSYEL